MTTIAGRNVVTFSSASSPSPALSARKPHVLHELGQAHAGGRIVLDDQHALGENGPFQRLGGLVLRVEHLFHWCLSQDGIRVRPRTRRFLRGFFQCNG